VAATLVFTATATATAQVTTGTIIGSVTDSSGVVPGATVTVREVNKGTTPTYVTDETGTYTAPFLVPGTYAVEVNVQGFKKSIREGIILQVNQRARVDVTLEVGRLEETMTVVSSAPLVRTDSSEVGTVIEERAIRQLPLNAESSRRSCISRPASRRGGRARTCLERARSTPAAPRISTRLATRRTPTAG
ncbi:MAG: carboxypeptidase-like regulatory domain-containing protein, partial [Vicinamibacterales bacterium]